jgi:hypothetical protein
LKAYRDQLLASQTGYEAGTVSLDIVLDVESRLNQSEVDYFGALSRYQIAITEVHYRKGSLIEYHGCAMSEERSSSTIEEGDADCFSNPKAEKSQELDSNLQFFRGEVGSKNAQQAHQSGIALSRNPLRQDVVDRRASKQPMSYSFSNPTRTWRRWPEAPTISE